MPFTDEQVALLNIDVSVALTQISPAAAAGQRLIRAKTAKTNAETELARAQAKFDAAVVEMTAAQTATTTAFTAVLNYAEEATS